MASPYIHYPYIPQPYHIPQTGHSSPYSRRRFDIPSSDPIEELEDPTLFPRIGTWLKELDNGVRGSDGHHFVQYAAALDDNKFTRIFQLEDLTDDKLIALCPGMPAGTATLIIGYAKKDVGVIRKKEARRLREVKMQPKRYI
jgi:hypothetical protein